MFIKIYMTSWQHFKVPLEHVTLPCECIACSEGLFSQKDGKFPRKMAKRGCPYLPEMAEMDG
jgi:hypothetical protein